MLVDWTSIFDVKFCMIQAPGCRGRKDITRWRKDMNIYIYFMDRNRRNPIKTCMYSATVRYLHAYVNYRIPSRIAFSVEYFRSHFHRHILLNHHQTLQKQLGLPLLIETKQLVTRDGRAARGDTRATYDKYQVFQLNFR